MACRSLRSYGARRARSGSKSRLRTSAVPAGVYNAPSPACHLTQPRRHPLPPGTLAGWASTLILYHGPRPSNCSRGTVSNASTRAGDWMLADARTSFWLEPANLVNPHGKFPFTDAHCLSHRQYYVGTTTTYVQESLWFHTLHRCLRPGLHVDENAGNPK